MFLKLRKFLSVALVYLLVANSLPLLPQMPSFLPLTNSAWAAGEDAKPDARRMSGCQDYVSGAKRSRGDACTVSTHEMGDQDLIISEGYFSILVMWAAAFMAIFEVKRCTTAGISCGWATFFTAVGSLALIAGEIAAIVGFRTMSDKIEYRADELRKNKEKCEAGAIAEGEQVGTLDDSNICDQYNALKAQKQSYEDSKSAAEWKRNLQIAGALCYAIAAGIEYYGVSQEEADDAHILAELAAAEAESAAAVAECTLGAAACEAACAPCQAAIAAAIAGMGTIEGLLNNPTPGSSQPECTTIRTTMTTITETATAACTTVPCAQVLATFEADAQARIAAFECPAYTCCELACQNPEDGTVYHAPKLIPTQSIAGQSQASRRNIHEMLLKPVLNPYMPYAYTAGIVDVENAFEIMRRSESEQDFLNTQTTIEISQVRHIQAVFQDEYFARNEVKMMNFMFTDAMAGEVQRNNSDSNYHSIITTAIGLASVAVIAFVGLLGVYNHAADGMYASPLKRALWNTAVALLAGGAALYTQYGVIVPLEDNIARLDNVLNSDALNTGKITAAGTGGISYNEVPLTLENPNGGQVIDNANQPLPCLGKGDGKGGCQSVTPQLEQSLASLGLGSLAGVAGDVAKLGNELSGSRSVSKGALDASGSLAGQSNAIMKNLKTAKDLINKRRAARGASPIPFAQLEKKVVKGMFDTAKDYMQKKGIDPKSMLGNIQPPSSDFVDKAKKAMATSKAAAGKNKMGTVKKGTTDPFAGFSLKEKEDADADYDYNQNEKLVEIDDGLNVRADDVVKFKDISLFDVISSRYIKSAYPTFFEEEKPKGKNP